MTLTTQLLTYLKVEHGFISGAYLTRMEWETKKKGLFKPESVGRALRLMSETVNGNRPRLEKKIENGTVFYRYAPSVYEKMNQNIDSQIDKFEKKMAKSS